MLENGMILNQEMHDIQMQEPNMVKCNLCGEYVAEYECRHSINNVSVCDECYTQEFEKFKNNEAIIKGFCNKNMDKFLLYWFDCLDENEKIYILRKRFLDLKDNNINLSFINDCLKNFCDCSEFNSFVEDKLNEQ